MSDVVTLGNYQPARTETGGRAGDGPVVVYQRKELEAIMQMYSRLVMAGHCRDYAIGFEKNQAIFCAEGQGHVLLCLFFNLVVFFCGK